MKKKTILIFWLIGFIIALVGAGLLVPGIAAAANHCTASSYGGSNCSLSVNDPLTYLGFIGVAVLIIGGLCHLIAWVGALIRSAKMGDWLWFIIVLIFNSLGILIYVIAGRPEPSYSNPH